MEEQGRPNDSDHFVEKTMTGQNWSAGRTFWGMLMQIARKLFVIMVLAPVVGFFVSLGSWWFVAAALMGFICDRVNKRIVKRDVYEMCKYVLKMMRIFEAVFALGGFILCMVFKYQIREVLASLFK